MSNGAADPDFEDAFATLTHHLSTCSSAKAPISLPAEVIEPFHHLGSPISSELLPSLTKLFQGHNNTNAIKLTPRAFYAIFTIVLSFPFCTSQQKVLNVFLDAVELYSDEKRASKRLLQCTGELVGVSAIQNGRQFICQKLAHHACTLLQHGSKSIQKQRMVAEIITRLLIADNSTAKFLDIDNFEHCLRDMLYTQSDYVIRLLAANIMRILACQRAVELKDLLRGCPSEQHGSSFVSNKADSHWIERVLDTLSGIDAQAAHESHDAVFRLSSFAVEENFYSATGRILAIISESLIFVLPAEENGPLRVIDIPFMAGMTLENSKEDTSALRVLFPNQSDCFHRGRRKAIHKFEATFLRPDDCNNFTVAVMQCSADAPTQDLEAARETGPSSVNRGRKQSLIFATMDWRSEDDCWVQEAQSEGLQSHPSNSRNRMRGSDTSIEDIVTDQPTTPSIFNSSSLHNQDTTLYKRMENAQLPEAATQMAKETPCVTGVDHDLIDPVRLEAESPTLRLSQPTVSHSASRQGISKAAVKLGEPKTKMTRTKNTSNAAATATVALPLHRDDITANQPLDDRQAADSPQLLAKRLQTAISPNCIDQPVKRISYEDGLDQELSTQSHQVASPCTPNLEQGDAGQNRYRQMDTNSRHEIQAPKRTKRIIQSNTSQLVHEVQPARSRNVSTRSQALKLQKEPIKQNDRSMDMGSTSQQVGKDQTATRQAKVQNLAVDENDKHTGTRKSKVKMPNKANGEVLTDLKVVRSDIGAMRNTRKQDTVPIALDRAVSATPQAVVIEEPAVDSASLLDHSKVGAQRINRSEECIVEESESPPLYRDSKSKRRSMEDLESADEENGDEVLAQDSYPLDRSHFPKSPIRNAVLATQIGQMLDTVPNVTDSSFVSTLTPFGNRKNFVANVNAARDITSQSGSAEKNKSTKKLASGVKQPGKRQQTKKLSKTKSPLKQSTTLSSRSTLKAVAHQNKDQAGVDDTSVPIQGDDSRSQQQSRKDESSALKPENLPSEVPIIDTRATSQVSNRDNGQTSTSPLKVGALARQSLSKANVPELQDTEILPHKNAGNVESTSKKKPDQQQRQSKAREEQKILDKRPSTRAKPRPPAPEQHSVQPSHEVERVSKPHVVHFNRQGPANQCKLPEAVERNSLSARDELEDKHRFTPRSNKDTEPFVPAQQAVPQMRPVPDDHDDNVDDNDDDDNDVGDDGVFDMADDEDTTISCERRISESKNMQQEQTVPATGLHLPLQPDSEKRITASSNIRLNPPFTTTEPNVPKHNNTCIVVSSDLEESQSSEEEQPDLEAEIEEYAESQIDHQLPANQAETLKPISNDNVESTLTQPLHVSTKAVLSTNRSQILSPSIQTHASRFGPPLNEMLVLNPDIPNDVGPTQHKTMKLLGGNITRVNMEAEATVESIVAADRPEQLRLRNQINDLDSGISIVADTGGDKVIFASTADRELMPPPPQRTATRKKISPTKPISRSLDQGRDMAIASSVQQGTKRAYPAGVQHAASPKRIKRSLFQNLAEQNPPASTPTSISAIMLKDLEEAQVKPQRIRLHEVEFKDDETTLLNPKGNIVNNVTARQSVSFDTDIDSSVSSESEPDFEGTPASDYQDHNKKNVAPVPGVHSGLRKALDGLTEIIVLRFEREEKAIHKHAAHFGNSASAILDRTQRSWLEGVRYEEQCLLRNLEAEQVDLNRVRATLKADDQKLQESGIASRTNRLIDERRKRLLQMLQPVLA